MDPDGPSRCIGMYNTIFDIVYCIPDNRVTRYLV